MKSDLVPIDENTLLIVGKMYHVRCAVMESGAIVPIFGIEHRDPDLGVPNEHFHIDGRFNVSQKVREFYRINEEGKTNAILPTKKNDDLITVVEIVIKKKKCISLTNGIIPPPREEIEEFGSTGIKYYKWYDKLLGKEVKEDICPHLGTKMVERDDILVCPLHNLRACKTTKLIIP